MRSSTPKPTRAELVRQRRNQKTAQRPVVTRVNRQERPKPKDNRRRYPVMVMARPQAIAIAVPGARKQKTLPRFRVGWRLLSGVLILLIVLALYALWTAPVFRVNSATIIGNQHLPADEIKIALGLNNVPVFLIAPEILEESLLRFFPELETVSVKVDFPARLTVTVQERRPVLAWIEDNAMTWVDAQGYAFRPRGDAPGLIVVMATGRPAFIQPEGQTQFLPPDLMHALRVIAPHVPAGTPILYDPLYGLGWNDPRGWRTYFGSSIDDLALKLRLHETLINALLQRGLRPSLVSVAYPNALIYRLEP